MQAGISLHRVAPTHQSQDEKTGWLCPDCGSLNPAGAEVCEFCARSRDDRKPLQNLTKPYEKTLDGITFGIQSLKQGGNYDSKT